MLERKGRLLLTIQLSELRKVNAVFKNVSLKKQNTSPLHPTPNHIATLLVSRTVLKKPPSRATCMHKVGDQLPRMPHHGAYLVNIHSVYEFIFAQCELIDQTFPRDPEDDKSHIWANILQLQLCLSTKPLSPCARLPHARCSDPIL